MTTIIRPRMNRRTVLRGLGGFAFGLPLLNAMRGSKASAAGVDCPKRLIVMYTPNGTIPQNFWPPTVAIDPATKKPIFEDTEAPLTELSQILTPLEEHKQDLLVIGGVDMLSAYAPNVDGSSPGDAHQKGTGHSLTATELLEGNFSGDGGLSAGWAGGISLDQLVANHVGQDTAYPSLELGVVVQGSSVRSRISYRGPGQPLPPENSPYAAYERLFGDSLGDPLEVQRRAARRHAVLDVVSEDYKKLRDQLGSEDKEKLHNHLLGIEAIRTRLDKTIVEFDGATCKPLELGAPIDTEKVVNMPIIGDLQMDLIAASFGCDITRVATLMWSMSTTNHVLSFVDPAIAEGHHTIAHKGYEDTTKVAQNTKINAWYAQQLANLITKLKNTPEGDGSVFDNTVILWTNEQSQGNSHDRSGIPYVIAGSAGGYFNTGRYVGFAGEVGHNHLLISLAQAMGLDIEEFGNPAYGTGALPGLT